MKRVAVQLALIGIARELDLDHLATLRGAPNGSVRNKIEKVMSPLNLPLAHAAIKRGKMSPFMEKQAKYCSTMKSIRTLAEKIKESANNAMTDMATLICQIEHAADVVRLNDTMPLCE